MKQRHLKGEINYAFISEKLSKKKVEACRGRKCFYSTVMANQTNQEENRNEQIIKQKGGKIEDSFDLCCSPIF